MVEQAVILAGGLGTRLGTLTSVTPKPLLSVGGRPFITWLLAELKRQGVRQVLILAGYLGEQFQAVAQEWPEARVIVEPTPLGTGGSVRNALDQLQSRFFLINGDSFFDVNLLDLEVSSMGTPILALRGVDDIGRYGSVQLDEGYITRFAGQHGSVGSGLINGGVGIFSRALAAEIPTGRPVSIEAEVYPRLSSNRGLRGRVYDRPFIDIGVPADFDRSQMFMPTLARRQAVIFDYEMLDEWGRGGRERETSIVSLIHAIKLANDNGMFAFLTSVKLWARNGDVPTEGDFQRLNLKLYAVGVRLDGIVRLADQENVSMAPHDERRNRIAIEVVGWGDPYQLRLDEVFAIGPGDYLAALCASGAGTSRRRGLRALLDFIGPLSVVPDGHA